MVSISGSVFDLIPETDREKLSKARQGLTPSQNTDLQQPSSHNETTTVAGTGSTPTNTQASTASSDKPQHLGVAGSVPLFHGSASFKPFSKDSAKQARYERYVELVKHGHKGEAT